MRESEVKSLSQFMAAEKLKETPSYMPYNHSTESMLFNIHSMIENFGLEVVSWHDKAKKRLYYTINPVRQVEPASEEEIKATVRVFSGVAPASLEDRATGVILGECQFDFLQTTKGFQIKIPIHFPGKAGYVRMYDPNEECIQQFSLDQSQGKIRVENGTELLINVPKVAVVNDAGTVLNDD